MDKISPDPELLKESFYNVKSKNTLIDRECALIQEASRFDMPFEKYEKLFELYDKDKISDSIIVYPSLNISNWQSFLCLWQNWFAIQNKSRLVKEIFNFLLEKGTLFSILLSAGHYIVTSPERTKQIETQKRLAHYQDWHIINSSVRKEAANGARIEALQALNEDKVNMDGVILEDANLAHINLKNAQLEIANFNNADLYEANLQMAKLSGAYFQKKANLNKANFKKAELSGVYFTTAYLNGTNFEQAKLDAAVFRDADLKDAILKDAQLCGTTFNDKYQCADFRGAKNLTVKQIKSAKDWEKATYDPEIRSKLGLQPEIPSKN